MRDRLKEILACPACKGPVSSGGGSDHFDCISCRLRYPVIDGIPVMLADEAVPIPENDDA